MKRGNIGGRKLNVYLALIIIFVIAAVSSIVFVGLRLREEANQRKTIMMDSNAKKVITPDEYQEKEKLVISSEKIRQIKEKELQRKSTEQKQATEKKHAHHQKKNKPFIPAISDGVCNKSWRSST